MTLLPHLFVRYANDAILHLVRVATGLDSLVVGDEQILGQLRSSLRLAHEYETSIAPLDGVVSRVLEAGRRIRTRTMLGRHPSLASAAVFAVQGVPSLPGVRLIDLDDLEQLCPVDVAIRRAEIEQAEVLAAQAAQSIARWLRVRAMSPAIVELRNQGHAIRSLELDRAAQQLAGLTPEQYSAGDHLTEAIVNKLLHGPTVALREAAAGSTSPDSSQSVVDVLRLDQARHVRRSDRRGYPGGLRSGSAR